MCPRRCDLRKRLPIRMKIRRANGGLGVIQNVIPKKTNSWLLRSAAGRENLHQFLRGNNFELTVGAVARLLVGAPSAKMRGMTKPGALHVLVCDFNHKLGTQWLPGYVLALAPAALASWYPMSGFTVSGLSPALPRMIAECAPPAGSEELHNLTA